MNGMTEYEYRDHVRRLEEIRELETLQVIDRQLDEAWESYRDEQLSFREDGDDSPNAGDNEAHAQEVLRTFRSQRQSTASSSTPEAEFVAASSDSNEASRTFRGVWPGYYSPDGPDELQSNGSDEERFQ